MQNAVVRVQLPNGVTTVVTPLHSASEQLLWGTAQPSTPVGSG